MTGVVGSGDVNGLVGREATSTGYVDVPPGRYWPGAVAMRTVGSALAAGAAVEVAVAVDEAEATAGAWPGVTGYGADAAAVAAWGTGLGAADACVAIP